jgi:cobyrinic acid a,c-diamide synthase
MVRIPRLVIAAPGSSHGKTSVTTGLLAALRDRGLTVSPHKVGPDYIDPGYHALAAGRVGRNLDPWLVGEELIAPLFLHGSQQADIAVVEGVMGLFDGVADRPGFASTAHVASLLSAPVVLVVDASGMSRSIAALVKGFASFEPAVRISGVILNRVGSDRHRQILTDALEEVGVGVLGVIGRHDSLVTPSRHLGLIPAAERAAPARETVAELGRIVGAGVDLDAIIAVASTAPDLPGVRWEPESAPAGRPVAAPTGQPVAAPAGRPVVAMAGGAAFTFCYAETAELLTAAGADVVPFDPMRDTRLPAGTAGLVLGGGFPEVHVETLADNEPLRHDIAGAVARGAAVAAECAGLLYLARSLDQRPMCGVVPADGSMTGRLRLGYREAVAITPSVLAAAGTRVRGHEFHRTTCTPAAGAEPAWKWRTPTGEVHTEGFVDGNVHASYLHLHWAGVPGAADRFVAACRGIGR